MTEQNYRTASPFTDNEVPRASSSDMPLLATGAESPFLNQYQFEPDGEVADAAAETVAELFAELYDEEFDEATECVVNELHELTPGLFSSETFDLKETARATHVMRQALEPISRAANAYLNEAEQRLASSDERSLSAARVAELLDEIEPQTGFASPAFDQFFGGLIRKVKKVASGAVKLAKKGLTTLASPLLKPILAKLKSLVPSLLDKVLKLALDKVPANYRPLAARLATKLQTKVKTAVQKAIGSDSARTNPTNDAAPDASAELEASEPAGGEPGASTESAAAEAGALQQALDQQLLELLVADDTEILGEAPASIEPEWEDHPALEVERGRVRFLEELEAHIERDESPAPAIENFLPVVLGAVRMGIKILGRVKVVSFLGGLLAKLIAPLIGKQSAPALGNMLADVGLRTLFQAELSSDDRRAAVGQAVAATIEETARQLAAVPERLLDTPELFELLAIESFEAAAAANFPAELIKPDLRESEGNDLWVMLPARGRKLYKKFSRTFDVSIPRPVADSIGTFGGASLGGFLRDRMSVRAGGPISARVHLYEAIPCTRLGHIARLEKVRGLGPGTRSAASLFHPLTTKAAAALLQAPRLGRRVADDAQPLRPRVGQRFYYLEVPEAPARAIGRQCHLHVEVNFPRDELVVCLHLSEVLTQKAAEMLRKGAGPVAVIRELRTALRANASALTSGDPGKRVRLILGARSMPQPKGLGSTLRNATQASVRRALGRAALEWLWLRLSEHLRAHAGAFATAAEAPEDGVRVCMRSTGITGLSALRVALLDGRVAPSVEWPPRHPPAATITISPGTRRD
jgi:hypothetical protein